MRTVGCKFNEEDISKLLMQFAEKFCLDDFEYVKHLKWSSRLETLDVVVLLDRSKEVVDHLYDALNYRLSENPKITTFFRSQNKESFLFPGGANIHFTDIDSFGRNYKNWNIIGGIVEGKYAPFFLEEMKDADGISFVLVLENTPYYSFEKEFDRFWREGKKSEPGKYS